MKRIIISILMALPLCAAAQNPIIENQDSVLHTQSAPCLNIAVFSYEQCYNAMPEVAKVKEDIDALREQYVAELKRAEEDFNNKYEDFLEQQGKLANSIRNKRQAELQKIMEENLAFKAKAQETLANTEAESLAPIKAILQSAIEKVAQNGGYNMVINRDNNTVPYIDGVKVTDITEQIITALSAN